jgi:hypothetical protein
MRTIKSQDAPHLPSFKATFIQLLRNPLTIVVLWNWKAALLSMFLRGPIFLVASVRSGREAVLLSLATELFFCAATAGFYGAIVQAFRKAQPQWLTLLFITVILPAILQGFEFLLHWARGTPHLRLAELVSTSVSGISAIFNWYVMSRNALLVGPEGARFKQDLARLPMLLLSFITALPRRLWYKDRGQCNVKDKIRCGAG